MASAQAASTPQPDAAAAEATSPSAALQALRDSLQVLLSLVPPSFTAVLPYLVVLFIALWLLRRVRARCSAFLSFLP